MTESDIDAATAACGSGVGFACLFVEAIEAAAVGAGVEPAAARALALGAVEGAARCLREQAVAPAELRTQVTSPAGTTAAGLDVLRDGGFESLVARAFAAARGRAAELGARPDRR